MVIEDILGAVVLIGGISIGLKNVINMNKRKPYLEKIRKLNLKYSNHSLERFFEKCEIKGESVIRSDLIFVDWSKDLKYIYKKLSNYYGYLVEGGNFVIENKYNSTYEKVINPKIFPNEKNYGIEAFAFYILDLKSSFSTGYLFKVLSELDLEIASPRLAFNYVMEMGTQQKSEVYCLSHSVELSKKYGLDRNAYFRISIDTEPRRNGDSGSFYTYNSDVILNNDFLWDRYDQDFYEYRLYEGMREESTLKPKQAERIIVCRSLDK